MKAASRPCASATPTEISPCRGASALETPVKGGITLEGANVSVFGDLKAPGGTLSFLAFNISPSVAELLGQTPGAQLPPPNPGRGRVRSRLRRHPGCGGPDHRLSAVGRDSV